MSVQKKPNSNTKAINMNEAEKFISGASIPTISRPKKRAVALRFDTELLGLVDSMAKRRGMSRNAIISYWCSRGVENESHS